MNIKKTLKYALGLLTVMVGLVSSTAYSGDIRSIEVDTSLADRVYPNPDNPLKAGDKVQLIGFGTFEVKETAAREGRNPKTGETIAIAAGKKPAFSASKALKDAIEG